MLGKTNYANNNTLYNNKYKKIEKLGNGSFGNVYKVLDINNPENIFAVKKYFLDNVNHLLIFS
jgi:serine/threonine protein kinase